MSERFIFTRHRTRCYHCGEDVDQIIKAVSAQTQVICSTCGATRIFIPRFENTGTVGVCTLIGRYDVWNIEAGARCKNCGVARPHDLVVGSNHMTTRCRGCGYTHFYRFKTMGRGFPRLESWEESALHISRYTFTPRGILYAGRAPIETVYAIGDEVAVVCVSRRTAAAVRHDGAVQCRLQRGFAGCLF
ncbi:MAG: hypothetical protein PHP55_05960 [Methanoculleus sp.]|nr:hypothetical protein [Methanoculleus sp.]